MYFTPTRTHSRTLVVSAHAGTRAAILARHAAEAVRAARAGGPVRVKFLRKLFDRLTDTRNLLLAAEHVAREGGPARGADGVGPGDLDRRDWVHLVRLLGRVLRDGTYRPGGELRVPIPKPSGGVRVLSVPLLADRVVQRAIVQVIQPYLDELFLPTTLGGRPGKSTAHALAVARRLAADAGHVAVTADVAKAFDVVPHDPLLRAVRDRLGHTRLTSLIDRTVRGRRAVGIAQGGALSPLLLNVYLDAALDRPWEERHPDRPLVRWVDDVLVLCPDRAAAEAALAELVEVLSAAQMPPKQDPAPAASDLRGGESVRWLGFRISTGPDGLRARIDETAWDHLDRHLRDAHRADHPAVHARQVIDGWVASLGPTYRHTDVREAYTRIREVAAANGFEEIPGGEEVNRVWEGAHRNYERECLRVCEEVDPNTPREWGEGEGHGAKGAAPPAHQRATIVPAAGNAVSPRPSTTPDTVDIDTSKQSTRARGGVEPARPTDGATTSHCVRPSAGLLPAGRPPTPTHPTGQATTGYQWVPPADVEGDAPADRHSARPRPPPTTAPERPPSGVPSNSGSGRA